MNRGKNLGRKRNHAGEVTSRVRVPIPRPPPLEQPSQRQVQELTLPSRAEQHSPTTEPTNSAGFKSVLNIVFVIHNTVLHCPLIYFRPEGISPPDWEWLIQHFGEAEFKKRSEINKQNRGKQTTVHTSGSQSFAEVADSMRNPDTGEPAPPDQVWEKQHTRKTKEGEKEWADPKSKEIYERLHELVVQQSQETENPLNNNQMLESVLGRRSGYVRGLGYGAKPPSSRGMTTLEVEARVESALGTVREQLDEERAKRAEMEKKLQEQYELERARRMEIEQKQSDLEAQVSALMTLFNQGQFQVPLPSNITRSNNEG